MCGGGRWGGGAGWEVGEGWVVGVGVWGGVWGWRGRGVACWRDGDGATISSFLSAVIDEGMWDPVDTQLPHTHTRSHAHKHTHTKRWHAGTLYYLL